MNNIGIKYVHMIHNQEYDKVQFFLRCTKILSQHHHFLYFLPSHFLPCKDTFMNDYDGI
jgi:hypothetical protein